MKYLLGTIISFFLLCSIKAQQLYFPPINNASNWETTTPQSLGWCVDNIDSLYYFLETNNTKAFIVLKDGKIVLEKNFGTFTNDSSWYWASAGKALTSLLVGQAQENGFLSINDTSSKYLGNGWTNTTLAQEQKITIRNQLTMTSGLDDGVMDNHCTTPNCLTFKADAGTRWAYHNAPYTLLDSVLFKSTGQSLNTFTQLNVKQKTGMNGAWFKIDYNNVFISTARSFARFGLLAQNNFIWNNDTLLSDTRYKNAMVNTSQSLNLSYGYLWWLNGKDSYMVPTSQFVIPGSYAPNAPDDMFAGIGKNGQIVSISKSEGLVVVRMGDAPGTAIEVPTDFCNKIWFHLNKVICTNPIGLTPILALNNINIYPNPITTALTIAIPNNINYTVSLQNLLGQQLFLGQQTSTINFTNFNSGMYYLTITSGNKHFNYTLVKQ